MRQGLQDTTEPDRDVRPWLYTMPEPGELRALRLCTNLSQSDVAEHVGVSRQTITAWESGDVSPSLETARELLGLYRATLVGGDNT